MRSPSRPISSRRRRPVASVLGALALGLAAAGCDRALPPGAVVFTETPASMGPAPAATDLLEGRYPAGSRVVLAVPPYVPGRLRVLSAGLAAAGDPVVAPDGRRVFFVAKPVVSAPWQVFVTDVAGSWPRAVTAIPGGAMTPAVIATGELIFCSPVPKTGPAESNSVPPAIYAQSLGGTPRRLTYGTGEWDPTVLADGRILFVATVPAPNQNGEPRRALFTVNNDGTEIRAFAGQHAGADWLGRPRELGRGRVGFLAAETEASARRAWAEAVLAARPFASRARLFPFATPACRSVEAEAGGVMLVCCESRGVVGRSMRGVSAIFRVSPGALALPPPMFEETSWDAVEATPVAPHPPPMGHLSTMVAGKRTGIVLCLDANRSTVSLAPPAGDATATAVRVVARVGPDTVTVLGQVPVQPDGSFLVEVPADTLLGFETIDAAGRSLRREAPSLWVRPGENRTCIGCHAPHNHSPPNHRPLAVDLPLARLGPSTPVLAQAKGK